MNLPRSLQHFSARIDEFDTVVLVAASGQRASRTRGQGTANVFGVVTGGDHDANGSATELLTPQDGKQTDTEQDAVQNGCAGR